MFNRPLVLCVVGAVAQCTYLAQQGQSQELEACVKQRGTTGRV